MGAWMRSVGIGSQATPCHITALQLWEHIYKSSTSTQSLAPAEKLNEDSLEALPGTSLSAVQYSTVRDTTDRVGLSHTGCSSAPHDCVTMQSSKHTQCTLQRFGGGTGGFSFAALFFPCAHCRLFYEYQCNVYLKNIIISKSNKHSLCVGTAHYFPDRCMRDGCRVELQQEMCHLSALMTERSI